MNAIDKIFLRLNKLKEFVDILKSYKGITAKELTQDVEKRAVIERYLQLAAEACLDIAELVIGDQRLEQPTKASEAIEILGKHNILNPKFANDFAKIAGFRNILIHDYIDIDYKEVADKVNNRLSDFGCFAQEVAKFLTA